MRFPRIDDRGFSLTELMFAMTIMAVGLLALAQMQIMAMRGTASAREFSTATKIAREGAERFKVSGTFKRDGNISRVETEMGLTDYEPANNDSEAGMSPDIDADFDVATLKTTLQWDMLEGFIVNASIPLSLTIPVCVERHYVEGSCDLSEDFDFVRMTNVRNIPDGDENAAVMKDISIIVIWKENNRTRNVRLRTLLASKDTSYY